MYLRIPLNYIGIYEPQKYVMYHRKDPSPIEKETKKNSLMSEEEFRVHVLPKSLQNDSSVLFLLDRNIFDVIYAYNNFDNDPDFGLFVACEQDNPSFASVMIEKGATYLKYEFYHACRNSKPNMIRFLISRGIQDWDLGLAGACVGGHLNIARLMIRKSKKSRHKLDWDNGLECACESGNVKLVNFMLVHESKDYRYALEGACKGGNLKIVESMFAKVSYQGWNNSHFLLNAGVGKHIKVINFLVEKARGTITPLGVGGEAWNYVFQGACIGGHIDLVKSTIGKTGVLPSLYYACLGGNLDIVKLVMGKISPTKDDFSKGLIGACRGGYKEIAELMISNGVNNGDTFQKSFENACENGHAELVILTIQQDDRLDFRTGFEKACENGHAGIVKLLLNLGKYNISKGIHNAINSGYEHIAEMLVTDCISGLNDFNKVKDYIIEEFPESRKFLDYLWEKRFDKKFGSSIIENID